MQKIGIVYKQRYNVFLKKKSKSTFIAITFNILNLLFRYDILNLEKNSNSKK